MGNAQLLSHSWRPTAGRSTSMQSKATHLTPAKQAAHAPPQRIRQSPPARSLRRNCCAPPVSTWAPSRRLTRHPGSLGVHPKPQGVEAVLGRSAYRRFKREFGEPSSYSSLVGRVLPELRCKPAGLTLALPWVMHCLLTAAAGALRRFRGGHCLVLGMNPSGMFGLMPISARHTW